MQGNGLPSRLLGGRLRYQGAGAQGTPWKQLYPRCAAAAIAFHRSATITSPVPTDPFCFRLAAYEQCMKERTEMVQKRAQELNAPLGRG